MTVLWNDYADSSTGDRRQHWHRRPFGSQPDDDRDWDVAIVGAGFTGLWAARSLLEADTSLSVVVLEADRVGFGASGRNGGWCSALFATSSSTLAHRFGAQAAAAMQAAMRATVDEVARAAAEDDIDCDFAKGGTLTVATLPQHVDAIRSAALAETDAHWLNPTAATARFATASNHGAAYTPHCAAVHPGKLVRGLAATVGERGVRIAERSPVAKVLPGRLLLRDGTVVRANNIIRATEGYTPTITGFRRRVVPIYSLMIATEPLADSVWDEIGLRSRETFTDGRRVIIYGQRTADGRIAFGGRGAPYHFGSRIRPGFDIDRRVFDQIETTLRTLLPQIGGARITHRWGGPLGVPRDWMSSVGFDAVSRIGWAGGYVGDGVSTTNLAGRTLADLVLGRPTELTSLPWVQHRSPNWEPEPARWIGINAGRALAEAADRIENRGHHVPALLERTLTRLTGG
ncbi:MAG: FAD-dependent oxidoreductase [Microthrixaceae bacterium]|nr:FAD-dependent oxidoreductase [Microthrixaceae bacterium]